MTIKTAMLAVASVSLAMALASAAQAGSFAAGCTTAPQGTWKAADTSAAKAVELGYKVAKTKISGSCHEVYATKDGQRFELFFDPVNNALVHTQAKG